VAYHDDDLTELDQLVRDWRGTADELADPARRERFSAAFTQTTSPEPNGPEIPGDGQRIPAV